jgi:hypothetical protein
MADLSKIDFSPSSWVFAFNASGKAPHVARNIRGEIVFEGQQADACVLHPAEIEAAEVEDILRDYDVQTVRLAASACAETNLQSEDVLIAQRGELLRRPASYLAPLLGLVENGTFEQLKTLKSEDFERFKKFCTAKETEIENKIETGIDGYGLLKIDNGSPNICVTTAEQEDAHRALISDQRKMLFRCFNVAPEIRRTAVGEAFIDAKRGKCGAIYANRLDLAESVQSFQRDNVRFSILPVWFEAGVIANRADEIKRENKRLEEQEQAWKHQKELDAWARAQRDKQKVAREQELQRQNGALPRENRGSPTGA